MSTPSASGAAQITFDILDKTLPEILNAIFTTEGGIVVQCNDIKQLMTRLAKRKAKIPDRKLGVAIYTTPVDRKSNLHRIYVKSTMRVTAPMNRIL